jgi:hypothetical protein
VISQSFVEEQAARYARRLDIEPPRVQFVERGGKHALRIRLRFGKLQVPLACLEELTKAEVAFATALAFARHLRIAIVNWGYLLGCWALGAFLGWLGVAVFQEYLLDHFWAAYAILLVGAALGYIVGMVIMSYHRIKMEDNIFHDALNLTGNPAAAESYLIRARAGELKSKGRTLSARERDGLSEQLRALREAAHALGLEYRPVSD